ncbi:hypothetical protein GCM10027416_15510 [Okibacterium endophyticum]
MSAGHRLVPPAVLSWAAAWVLIVAEEPAAIVACLCWMGGVAACMMMAARLSAARASWFAPAALALVAVAMVASVVALVGEQRHPQAFRDAADSNARGELLVRVDDKTEPYTGGLLAGTSAQAPAAERVSGTAIELTVGEERVESAVPVVVMAPAAETPPDIGATVRVTGDIVAAEPGDAAAFLVFSDDPVQREGTAPWYLSWANELRSAFVELASSLPGAGGDLLPGLAVGDTRAVDDDLDEAMVASSLSHLTAVSGANCAVIVAVVSLVLSVGRAPRWLRISASLLALGGFVILVTPEPSVARAALMAVAVLISLAGGRPAAGLPVLCMIVVCLVISDPWLARSYAFALSVLATAGLLVLTAPITHMLARVLPRMLAALIAIPLAAQLACQPVLVLLEPSIALYGVPANLIAGPAAPAATMLGLFGCVFMPLSEPIALCLLWLGWVPSSWIAAVATTVDGLPLGRLPWLPGAAGALLCALMTILIWLCLRSRARVQRVLAVICTIVIGTAGVVSVGMLIGAHVGSRLALPSDWRIAACDIGQGDAVFVRSHGAVALVDTGPDPELLAECIGHLGIDSIDLLVLTHFDMDHVGGVRAVRGMVVHTLSGKPENASDELLLSELQQNGSALQIGQAGDRGTLGALSWQVIWPKRNATSMATGNDGSVVVVLEGDGNRSLFLGDLGEEAQEALVATGALKGAFDVVKVAHHGSGDQSERLYSMIRARVAVISVGRDNDYGHPTASILAILARSSSVVLRTDHDGLVAIEGSGERLFVWTQRVHPP